MVEPTVEKNADGTPKVPVQPATPAVKTDVKPAQPEAVDAQGVPYKNRAAEAQRKLEKLEQEKIDLQNQVTTLQTPQPEASKEEEDEWKQEARRIAREEARALREENNQGSSSMRTNLDKLEEHPKKGSLIKKYRAEIETHISKLEPDLQVKPATAERVANMILGDHIGDEEKPAPTPPKEKLTSIQTASPSSPSSPEATTDELTPEEDAFADKRGYFDQNYSTAEIKKRYKDRQETLKKNSDKK